MASQSGFAALASAPGLDVREDDKAYYLEGEFPGIGDANKISLTQGGKNGLLIETKSTRLDLSKEWNSAARGINGDADGYATKVDQDVLENHCERIGDNDLTTKQDSSSKREDPLIKTGAVWLANKAKGGYSELVTERHIGHLQRSFIFPKPVDLHGLKANLSDGLLRIKVPKKEQSQLLEKLRFRING